MLSGVRKQEITLELEAIKQALTLEKVDAMIGEPEIDAAFGMSGAR